MTARLRKLLDDLSEMFWLVPFAMVLLGILGGVGLVRLDRSGLVPQGLVDSDWLYSGGATGARTMLGAIASSTIGVAGTVFSITIAALSLAAGQMGPRLLRNFTSDRANQVTLGTFLATFAYALTVLRSVRSEEEGAFVPHLSLSAGLLLAFVSVGTLVFFVAHIAGRINVDTVIDLVGDDVRASIAQLTRGSGAAVPDGTGWEDVVRVTDPRQGYLQHLDVASLADWAARNGTTIAFRVRPGDYVFPGAVIAHVGRAVDGIADAIRAATALGPRRTGAQDLEFPVRQLVEVGVRAMSAGINDPHTAQAVLDRLGAALCDLAPRRLPDGIERRDGRPVLRVPAITYDGLVDAMFHMIRQDAAGSTAVLARMLEVLAAVAGVEVDPERRGTLRRHARLVLADAERSVQNPADLDDVRGRAAAFFRVCETDQDASSASRSSSAGRVEGVMRTGIDL